MEQADFSKRPRCDACDRIAVTRRWVCCALVRGLAAVCKDASIHDWLVLARTSVFCANRQSWASYERRVGRLKAADHRQSGRLDGFLQNGR